MNAHFFIWSREPIIQNQNQIISHADKFALCKLDWFWTLPKFVGFVATDSKEHIQSSNQIQLTMLARATWECGGHLVWVRGSARDEEIKKVINFLYHLCLIWSIRIRQDRWFVLLVSSVWGIYVLKPVVTLLCFHWSSRRSPYSTFLSSRCSRQTEHYLRLSLGLWLGRSSRTCEKLLAWEMFYSMHKPAEKQQIL